MKKIGFVFRIITLWLLGSFSLWAQDTTPRGPAEWTSRNWLGFFIQIALFLLAVIGIYKLAGGDDKTEGEGRGEAQNRENI